MKSARRTGRVFAAASLSMLLAAHVGSPDVFFAGKAGAYDVRVVIRPPEVVPGIARVVVHAPPDVEAVSIRPVYWRAGSRGAPAADVTRRAAADPGTFQGNLWLMARGAYSVDVIVSGARGSAHVLVPVASVATGRLTMSPALAALLAIMGLVLCAGLVNIVFKAAGESLLEEREPMDAARRATARRAAAIAIPVLALALFGGARWWTSVDRGYERGLYRPSPMRLMLSGDTLRIAMTDTVWQPPARISAIVPDHGKPMHFFLVRADDARALAHLHPRPTDTSALPEFVVRLPPLPPGSYNAYGDVVHETGFERTLVGSLSIPGGAIATAGERADPDDAWFVGEATRGRSAALGDGSSMQLEIVPAGLVEAGGERLLRATVVDAAGRPAPLEPYMGMSAHAVVVRVDGAVFVHLHPTGTVTMAAQEAFRARDRGDTTADGRLRVAEHAIHAGDTIRLRSNVAEFPYAFPKSGSYRLFVQVKRNGRVLTGAFAVTVAEPTVPAQ